MAAPTPQLDPRSAEMLAIVRRLLIELGSHQAAENVGLNSSFERDLGLGSLERVELLVRTERHFQCRLPDETAQRADTPAEWVRAVADGSAAQKKTGRYRIEPSGEAPEPFAGARSFLEVLRTHVETEPERIQIHLLEGHSGQPITYAQLLERSREVAAGLTNAGLERNETVAIMLPTCEDFFYSFLGTMLAGGIAVPIYPPARPDKIEEYVRRQVQILQNAQVRFLISFDQVKAVSQVMRLSLPTLIEVTTVSDLRQRAAGKTAPEVDPCEAFFIQYTSGSTGNPKGVVLTHGNVLANVRGIGWAVQARPDDVVVSWLPLYHDMGLIGSWLFSVYYAFPITILSPLDFLSRPERWLRALSDSRASLCPAPNFSYELCARKITDDLIEGVDLSRWRVAINAGEPVLPETLERFAERFEPYGFRRESYVPCYGLAESSVALTFPPIDRPPVIDIIRRGVFEKEGRAVPAEPAETNVMRFVANGKPLPDHEIRILDDSDQPVAERVRGRVFFRGPSRTSGYHRNPEATAAVTTEDGWMDTGDLGYWADGEIYITGRKKDTIIKGGHNITPQEIETGAAEVAGVRRGCVSAFGILDRDTGTERLVVVAETRTRDRAELARIEAEVIKVVDEKVGMPPDQVELVPPQTIPKTSSGKIRRTETRTLYESGQLIAKRRPPWMQIVRLWTENLDGWARYGWRRTKRGFRDAYTAGTVFTVGLTFGMLARVLPTRASAAAAVRAGAKVLLALNGQSVQPRDRRERRSPAVLVANRAGQFDLLPVVAGLSQRVALADRDTLSAFPLGAAFLLEPLAAPSLDGELDPPGGSYAQRIRQALAEGQSVLVFAENSPETPVEQNRYRLEPIRAAAEIGAAIVPVRVSGTEQILNGKGPRLHFDRPRVNEGNPIAPKTGDLDAATILREQIRNAIANLPH